MQRIANIFGATGGNHAGWIYDKGEDAPSINTGQGGVTNAIDNRGKKN